MRTGYKAHDNLRTKVTNPMKQNSFFIALLASFCFLYVSSAHSISGLLGVHPLDEKYFSSEVIKCKDGSKSFTRDRLNDNFCDCLDGTDEPGTSACPAAKFYCRNVGSIPRFIFASRVNDRLCDCCDGSDEYDGSVNCPNTCVMGGNVEHTYFSTINDLGSNDAKGAKNGGHLEDLIQNLKGLKIVIIMQLVLIKLLALLWIFYRRVRSRRRRNR